MKCVKKRQELIAEQIDNRENIPKCETAIFVLHNKMEIEKTDEFINGHEKHSKNYHDWDTTNGRSQRL